MQGQRMTAATLFSGIGAPEVAMPEWDWIWHAEIEKFPVAVMAARHPQSVNLGDVTADDFVDRALAIGRPDVVIFGSPCQSYSVAGQRLGLADPRGNIALVALSLLARIAPRWFVFENVPGLLSSQSGGLWDFGVFLGAVQECGYQCAWASLDAQFFGLAQRRERVFVVGHASDWRRAAAVLLEPESLCGHPPTRGEAREDVTGTLGARSGRSVGAQDAEAGLMIPEAPPISLCLNAGAMGRIDAESETLILIGGAFDEPTPIQSVATVREKKQNGIGIGRPGDPMFTVTARDQHAVAHSLRADGFDASEDGTGRGTPLVAVCDPNQVTSKGNRSQPTPELSHTLPAKGNSPIAFTMKDYGGDAGDISPTLRSGGHDKSHANGGVMPAVAYAIWSHASCADGDQTNRSHVSGGPVGMNISEELAYAVRAGRAQSVATLGVRRLMPVECERLQGLPDGYTAIPYRGKPAADGPRYKAIGNSMAVTVVQWILTRLERVHHQSPRAPGLHAKRVG